VTYLAYDPGAAALVRALQEASRTPNTPGIARHQLHLDRAIVALLRVPAPDAIVPGLLGEWLVWDAGSRDEIVSHVDGGMQTFVTPPATKTCST
jgi:hypothetical protein